jgi:hypothetical protein
LLTALAGEYVRSGTGFRYELAGQDNIDADQFTKEMWKQWEQEAEVFNSAKMIDSTPLLPSI